MERKTGKFGRWWQTLMRRLRQRFVRQKWLWLAPNIAIGVFALSMLAITATLQFREQETALAALEGDMQWAERTIESRMLAHQDFLAALGRDIEARRVDGNAFQWRAAAYLKENADLAAILWVNPEGQILWAASQSTKTDRVNDILPPKRLQVLKEALENGRFAYSGQYANADKHHVIDLFRPVQQDGKNAGALISVHSLENLLNATLPDVFSNKYSLTLVDETGQPVISNANITPTDHRVSGLIRLNLLDSRIGLQVAAYRTEGLWKSYLPAIVIIILTAITAGTLVLLRRNAQRRAESEEQLRNAYAFRQAMSQSLLTTMRAVDMEGRITYVNKAFCNLVGWSEEELIGTKAPFPYWPPEDREKLLGSLKQTLTGDAPLGHSEARIVNRAGEYFDVSVYVSPLIDSDSQQLGWMVAMNDITEQKRIRDELHQAQERFVTVVDGLDSAVHVTDIVSGEILFANRVFNNLCGFDTIGHLSPAIFPALQPPKKSLLRDPGQLKTEDLPCELFDGALLDSTSGRWYRLHDRAIRWVDGRTVRIKISTDITENKSLHEREQQQKKRVEETSRLITMGEMASSLAHELNQPLSAIANYCAGCVKRIESGNFQIEDLLTAMKRAGNQAQRAGKIIHRMRDLAKKNDPYLEAVALADIVDETLALANIEANRLGAEINLNIAENLPRVMADRIMIEQVLLNLAKNGIEAMVQIPEAERHLEISACIADERMIELAVADCGCGMSEQEMENVFAPFYTTKAEGLGIGLAICRSIVEFHKGRLWAERRPQGGTIFKLTLPREP
ncbi:MAG: domain S-box protein [Proteobacteria bacterium]|nr:domain S-box protein [Pseudomonadota bacterium]